MDCSSSSNAGQMAAQRYTSAGATNVHMYNESMMISAYPVLLEMGPKMVQACGTQWEALSPFNTVSLAWGFHVEAILVWYTQCCGGGTHGAYSHVWVIEDDVGFSGDIVSSFLAHYATDTADLVSHTVQPVYVPQVDRNGVAWCWINVISQSFDQHVPHSFRWKGAEHVQRFSGRFLSALDQLCSQGLTAWSEQAVPSLCAYLGMQQSSLLPHHIGTPFTWDGRVSESDWCKICSRETDSPESEERSKPEEMIASLPAAEVEPAEVEPRSISNSGKLYHALKF